MSTAQVFLILVSGLGVLHGLLLAIFLWSYSKGSQQANKILSLLLLVLSFRVGKSVIMEFVDGESIKLIFTGLATLLIIGPLFYFYTRTVLEKGIRVTYQSLFHFIPSLFAIGFGLWISDQFTKETPVLFFVALFAFYYGHYLAYLIISFLKIKKAKEDNNTNRKAVQWLSMLGFALGAIWVTYTLNLVEEKIPYVLGPILYSVIAYGTSYAAFKYKFIDTEDQVKYKTTPLAEEEADQIFASIEKLIAVDKLYKNPDLSLATLSKLLKVSPQKISMVINSRFKYNFNGYLNHYRIKEAKQMLIDEQFKDHTIASIAFEVGFNSLTSFNTAFKKETNQTPSGFRKDTTQIFNQ